MGFAALALALALVGGATPAKALTQAEVNAIIQVLGLTGSQATLLQGLVTGGGSAGSCSFTGDLTMGSRGADVTCLQNYLTGTGHFTFSGGATGYFGSITKAAVAAWQAANGVSPAAGYFGSISRAKYSSMAGPTPTTPTTPTTPPAGITTPGIEGTLTVSKNPSPSSGITIREGETKVAVLGLEIEAKNSDLAVQRVKLNIGTTTTTYTKIFSRVYLMDGSTVVAQSDLNSSTVFKEGSNYFVQITGFSWIVPKNTKRILTVAMDMMATIKAADQHTWTLTLPVDGVRALDGANIDQKSPSTAFSNDVTTAASLTDSANLIISLNSASPVIREVVASQGTTEDEYDKMDAAIFDLKAEKDSIKIVDMHVQVLKSVTVGASTATATTAYLYDGSTLVGSAAISSSAVAGGMDALFDDIDYVVPKDTTKPLTVKLDIRDAQGNPAIFEIWASSTGITAESSTGGTITKTGSTTGERVTVRNTGAEFTLLSKTIEKSATASQNNVSTSTAKATFTLRIKAVGADVMFGTVASTSPLVGTTTISANGGSGRFDLYQNSVATSSLAASSTDYTTPASGVVTAGLTESWTLSEGNSIDLPVSFTVEGRHVSGALFPTGSYTVGLESIRWVGPAGSSTSNFMAGKSSWRTAGVTLP